MAKSYTKRADGRYQKRVRLTDQNGIEFIKVVYAKTLDDLDEKARKVKNDNECGLYRNDDITVGKYSEKWLETIYNKRSENTYASYGYSVGHIKEKLGVIEMRRLKRQDIQAAIDSFMEHPRTAQIFRMTINRICDSAIDDGIIARNPCRNIAMPVYKTKEKRPLNEVELNAIERADLDAEERLLVSLLYYCGLRRGEALALGRGDIDLKRRVLTVNHSLAFIGNKGILKEPKTAKSRREIPIPAQLKELLKAYKYDLFLFTRNGGFFTHYTFDKLWASIIRKLNEAAGGGAIDRIQGLTPHVFRHNYASLLHRQGWDVKDAQSFLGHSSIIVTMDIYTHLDELNAEKVNAIDDMFSARRA